MEILIAGIVIVLWVAWAALRAARLADDERGQ